MSSEVKRWLFHDSDRVDSMGSDFRGNPKREYVAASDYDALKAERDALRGQPCKDCCCARIWRALGLEGKPNPSPLHDMYEHVATVVAERDTLAAQVEAQRPVIDAAAVFVRDSYRPSATYDGERFDALCAALTALGIAEERAEDAMKRDAALAAPSVGDVEVAHPTNCECPRCARPGPSPVGGTVDELRNLCAEVYQVCGFYIGQGMTSQVLDNLAAAANGTPLPHKTVIPFDGGATGEAGYAGPERRVLRAPATAYLEFIGYVYARGPQRSLHANTRAAKGGGK